MNKPIIIWQWVRALLVLVLLTPSGHVRAVEASMPSSHLQSLLELSESPPTTRSPTIKAWKLRQNTKVLFVENHSLPMIDVQISFAAGSMYDGHAPGLAAMVLSLFNEGSALKDGNALAKEFDRLGVVIGNNIKKERSHFTMRSLSAAQVREPAMAVFTEMLSQPGFSLEGQRRVKSELLTKIHREHDAPHSIALNAINKHLYPNQTSTRSVYGSPDSLELIDEAQLRAFYRRAYTAANAQIVIVGDLTEEQAQRLSQSLADTLPDGPALAPPQPASLGAKSGKTLHIDDEATHTSLTLAQNALPYQHPDAMAVRAGNVIFSHILNAHLREKYSVTYGVISEIPHAQGDTPWIITLNTPSRYSNSALAHIKTLFATFLENGPSQTELDDIKQYLLRALPQLTASNLEMRNELALISRFDQPLDFNYKTRRIQTLTREQIKTAMNRHFTADGWVSVSVGPSVEQLPLPEMMLPDPMQAKTCTPTNWATPGQHTKFGRRPLLWQLIHNTESAASMRP